MKVLPICPNFGDFDIKMEHFCPQNIRNEIRNKTFLLPRNFFLIKLYRIVFKWRQLLDEIEGVSSKIVEVQMKPFANI